MRRVWSRRKVRPQAGRSVFRAEGKAVFLWRTVWRRRRVEAKWEMSDYLTYDLVGQAGLNGIIINGDDVSLDLVGVSITGLPSSNDGILVQFDHRDIEIQNGSQSGGTGDGS